MPWPTIVWPRCFRNRAGRPPGGTGIGPCRQRPPHDVLSSQDSASADSLKPVRENGGGARRSVPPLARSSGMPRHALSVELPTDDALCPQRLQQYHILPISVPAAAAEHANKTGPLAIIRCMPSIPPSFLPHANDSEAYPRPIASPRSARSYDASFLKKRAARLCRRAAGCHLTCACFPQSG